MPPRRAQLWLVLLVGVVIASACAAPQFARRPGVFIKNRVFVLDPDDYMRFVRLREMVETGAWRLDRMEDLGPPPGTRMHWTMPNDYLMLAAYRIFCGLPDNDDPLATVSAWLPVALGWLAVLIVYLGLWRAVDWPTAVLGALLTGFSKTHQILFALGHPDHHALFQLLLTVSFVALLCGTRRDDRIGRGWMIGGGAAMGLAIWVVVQAVVFWAVATGALAAAAVFTNDPARRRNTLGAAATFSAAVFAVVLVGHVLENAPGVFTRTGDMISVVHVILTGLTLAALLIAARGDRPTRVRIVLPLVGAAVVFGAYAFVDRDAVGGWAAHPLDERWFEQILEFQPLVQVVDGKLTLAALHDFTGFAVYALPVLLVFFARSARVPRVGRFLFVMLAIVVVPLGLRHVRWMLHSELLWATVAPIGLIEILAFIPPLRHRRWAAVGVAAVLAAGLCWPAWKSYYVDSLGDPDMAAVTTRSQRIAAMSEQLRRYAESTSDGHRNAIITDWTSGPAFLYFSRLPVVAAPYHRVLDGIDAASRFFCATDPREAYDIAERLGARFVDVPEAAYLNQADMESLLFGEPRSFVETRHIADDGRVARRVEIRPDARVSMMARLFTGNLLGEERLYPLMSGAFPTEGGGTEVRPVVYEILPPR